MGITIVKFNHEKWNRATAFTHISKIHHGLLLAMSISYHKRLLLSFLTCQNVTQIMTYSYASNSCPQATRIIPWKPPNNRLPTVFLLPVTLNWRGDILFRMERISFNILKKRPFLVGLWNKSDYVRDHVSRAKF